MGPHKGAGIRRSNSTSLYSIVLDRPAGEISRPVVFWRVRRARRADYGATPPAHRAPRRLEGLQGGDRQGADAQGHDGDASRGRRDDDPQGEDDGGQVSPLWTPPLLRINDASNASESQLGFAQKRARRRRTPVIATQRCAGVVQRSHTSTTQSKTTPCARNRATSTKPWPHHASAST